jgi:2-polyprenyl-6-methoxyphenol hydroxylase-like FAD-dependent oxidoreductase
MANHDSVDTPVLIVGGGPIGLSLALDLGRRGVACQIVEQSDGIIYHPKATALNARTMELMRRFGVSEQVKRDGTSPDFPHTVLYLTGFDGYEIARIERPSHGGLASSPISPERPQRCNQLWLDPILRDRVLGLGNVTLRYRCRFEALIEEGDGVVVTVTDLASEKTERITAQYLVDCSGARSPIRRAFGIKMSGQPATEYNVSVFMRIPELWKHHDKGKSALTFFIDEKGGWRNLVMIDGKELYRFAIMGKEYYDNYTTLDVDAMFGAVGSPSIAREVISVIRWTARDVVADKYRVGRVFMAGDAAHRNHPTGGFGLNTGMGDVDDLGWKLAAVLQGWGGAGLLDSYETERRPVGLRNINQAWTGFADNRDRPSHPEIAMDTVDGAAARKLMRERIMESQVAMVLTDGLALGYRYEGSPIIIPDGTELTPDTLGNYRPTARPGSRAPHAWIWEGRSTVDLFGAGFVLLSLGTNPPEATGIEAAFRRLGVPLDIVTLTDPAIAALYEQPLVLVRPDGHVAWRGATVPADSRALADRVRGARLET